MKFVFEEADRQAPALSLAIGFDNLDGTLSRPHSLHHIREKDAMEHEPYAAGRDRGLPACRSLELRSGASVSLLVAGI
jgi:hypothetical protein